MDVANLLNELGYSGSPNFLPCGKKAISNAPDFGHIFRRAESMLDLQGVYALQPKLESSSPGVPVVYICKAQTQKRAEEIHRLVWNQDIVPFLIVSSPSSVRLYSGFRHGRTAGGTTEGLLQTFDDGKQLSRLIDDFHAESIDSGNLWRRRGKEVTPDTRVDWKLLDNLRALDRWLVKHGLTTEVSHALIGKYVYLHYLRDRGILSPAKLRNKCDVAVDEVFGRSASVKSLRKVIEHLEDWLNGGIFPLDFEGRFAPTQDHVRCVAGVFEGDEITELGNRQLSLDFQAYDFSYIPIETLSIVYEQFLHAPSQSEETTKGRQIGAYYTPIPVVNLMLSELDERRPLQRGMRVFDPSCGSGAFLVQCYRRLIERIYPPGSNPKPRQLRDLLEGSIFGVDVEEDACKVTELSLVLTLLDYVEPPDLEGPGRKPHLPRLRNSNIYCSNFFGNSALKRTLTARKFDWVVGNPPWKRLTPEKLDAIQRPVWDWIEKNQKQYPVGGNQAARAFAWEVLDYVAPGGEVAMFLPAMSLFEDTAIEFRKAFFRHAKVNTVVNLANLAEVLSAKRFRVPAAAFFYEPREESALREDYEFVRTYSPLVANQEATRPVKEGLRNESWSIVINASEIRDIPWQAIEGGSGLPWKLATWGSSLDLRLLSKLDRQFPSARKLEKDGILIIAEGPALVKDYVKNKTEKLDEVVDKKVLDTNQLARLRQVFTVPPSSLRDNDNFYADKRRGFRGVRVCRPPHVIVGAARNFAIYSNKYIIVPPRQIGIASATGDKHFLKALSLYLSSDFAFYHQFLTSTQFGVQRGRATLDALRRMPIALDPSNHKAMRAWSSLHKRMSRLKPVQMAAEPSQPNETPLFPTMYEQDEEVGDVLKELNDMVFDALRLDESERALVSDLVRVRMALNDGKVGKVAIEPPAHKEVCAYARRLRIELDDFIGDEVTSRHAVSVVYDGLSGMIQTELNADKSGEIVLRANTAAANELESTRSRLRNKRAQWVYFDRSLRIYEGTRTFLFKPMQRFHWTESQAMIDARQIIKETIALEGVE